MRIHLAEGLEDRHVLQLIPDRTGRIAILRDAEEEFELPIVGFASILRLAAGQMPVIEVGPVVEEENFGPITIADLLHEIPILEYVGQHP